MASNLISLIAPVERFDVDTDSVPSAACCFSAAEVLFGTSGAGAETANLEIICRSPNPIDHWYWGRVVHDLDGVSHKGKIPVDYCHRDDEIVGYLDRFDVVQAGLRARGRLVSIDPQDRTAELIAKSAAGIPWEASIFFDGDHGLSLESVSEGATADVNGRQMDGPLTVVRQWRLRGLAICPHGYDRDTESSFTTQRGHGARIILNQKGVTMTTARKKPKATTPAPAPEELTPDLVPETVTPDPVAPPAEELAADPPRAADPDEAAVAEPATPPADMEAWRLEAQRFSAAFGDQGLRWFMDGLTFESAQAQRITGLESENQTLRDQLAAAADLAGEHEPASFQADNGKPAKSLKDVIRIRK